MQPRNHTRRFLGCFVTAFLALTAIKADQRIGELALL